MHDPVEQGVGNCWLTDPVMPFGYRVLARQDQRIFPGPIINQFQYLASRAGIQGDVGALLLASVTMVVLHVIPSAEEIRSLQETVDRLERRGGRALVVVCPEEGKPKRLCVRIFDEQTNREGFRVIAGYQ